MLSEKFSEKFSEKVKIRYIVSQRSWVVQCGGFFSLAIDSQTFSGELVWFASLLGVGNSLERIYYVRPK
jgi:hypothetical protein